MRLHTCPNSQRLDRYVFFVNISSEEALRINSTLPPHTGVWLRCPCCGVKLTNDDMNKDWR